MKINLFAPKGAGIIRDCRVAKLIVEAKGVKEQQTLAAVSAVLCQLVQGKKNEALLKILTDRVPA